MIRVCGVTYDHTLNYGSGFQACALKKAVENLKIGQENCSYDLAPLFMMRDYVRKRPLRWYLRRTSFAAFERPNMSYADCKLVSDLTKLNDDYDAFVCGSDVIWRTDLNRKCSAYYLDFATKYKFSYAASFGRTGESGTPPTKSQIEALRRMDEISCRDAYTQNRVRELTGRDSRLVCDPVLLLHATDWEKVAAKTKKNYMFSYCTHHFNGYDASVNKLGEQTGLSVVNAGSGDSSLFKYVKRILLHTPQRWLRLLLDADVVVTNFFHATVFCVMFHKKYITLINGNKDEGTNLRMSEFLRAVKQEDHLFNPISGMVEIPQTDFSRSDQIIAEMRDEGLSFLKENLNKAYERKQAAPDKEKA